MDPLVANRPAARVQFSVVALLLHGFVPCFFLGGPSVPVPDLVANAVLGAVLAWALWHGWRWALSAALIFIALQTFVVSTPFFAWELSLGGRFGLGIEPRLNLLDAPIFTFRSLGWRLIYSVWQPSPALLAEFQFGDGAQTFVAFNFPAGLVLLPLVAVLRQRVRQRSLLPPRSTVV